MTNYANPNALVSTDWLAANLSDPSIRIVESNEDQLLYGTGHIPGTTPFDGVQAMKGYALNKMCFSFNDAANRAGFLADEEAYMRKYWLNAQQAWDLWQSERTYAGELTRIQPLAVAA